MVDSLRFRTFTYCIGLKWAVFCGFCACLSIVQFALTLAGGFRFEVSLGFKFSRFRVQGLRFRV